MSTRSMKVLKALADEAFEPEKKPKKVIPKKKDETTMTKEEIEQYIDLDDKIKNRIVQISHALHCISGPVISKFVPDFRYWNLDAYDKEDFIENSQEDKELHLGLECYDDDDSSECNFSKSLLMMTDEQINEIVEYDRKQKEEAYKRQEEAAKARQEKLKKEVEEKEYEQYLRLKKKFEKE